MIRSLAWVGLAVLALSVGCGSSDSTVSGGGGDGGTGTGGTGTGGTGTGGMGTGGTGTGGTGTGGTGTGGMGGDGGTAGVGGALSEDFSATIVRTTYGIPHVTADDFGSLGYGAGYAYAQDNFCVLMREVVVANGESARYLGDSNGNQNRDYIYRFFASDEYVENVFLPAASRDLQHLAMGYAAGFSRHLAETGVENLPEGPEGCRDAEWVRPITDVDLAKVYRKLILRAGISQLTNLIIAANDSAPTQSLASLDGDLIESEPIDFSALGFPEPTEMGSNAYGIGAEGSQSASGLLLGNPHFPWRGPERWYVQHLTVPGQYDVMGASLQGVPVVNIGFNSDLAWSHTVSTAQRFGLYVLDLVDDNPYQYHYDDEIRDIETNPVTIEVKLGDGTIEERTKNIYTSHFGPILDLGALSGLAAGWPTTIGGNVFAVRDANIDNTRILDQFTKMGQSHSIDDLEDALKDIALPWVNTIAADRDGTGYYADVSTVPNISQAKLEDCGNNLFGLAVTNQGIATLDGSRSECEWGTDPDGPEGLLGFGNLPKIRTSATVPYVSNSNDSYWLSSPNMLLENYSPLMGRNGFEPPERIEQSLRTRQGFVQAEERIAGTDGLGAPGFNIDNLRDIMFGSRNIAAELTLDDVIDACEGVADWSAGDCDGNAYSANPAVAAGACAILDDWDRRFNIDSVGAGLWNEVWRRIDRSQSFWVTPFDPNDAVNTPRTVNMADGDVVEAIRCGIGEGVDTMVSRAMPLDADWGTLQFRWNGDRSARIPVHGGSGSFMWSVISANYVAGEGYSDIPAGNSYIQTVTWDESECPDAFAVLTYSQSTDPTSPHYSDWTELMSGKDWNDMPYCPADVEAQKISETVISTDDE